MTSIALTITTAISSSSSSRDVSASLANRVDALTPSERRRRLEEPEDHVDPDQHKGFNSLAYLHGPRPDRAQVDRLVQRIVVPLLFDYSANRREQPETARLGGDEVG